MDARHGWAIGSAQIFGAQGQFSFAIVLRTTDGGQNWHLLPAPNAITWPDPRVPYLPVVDQINFTSRTEGAVQGTRRFVTHDGGMTWEDAGPVEVQPSGVALRAGRYRLQSTDCTDPDLNLWPVCTHTLWRQAPGQGWQPTDIAFVGVSARIFFSGYWPRLIAASANVAWIVHYNLAQDGFTGHVLGTQDGGATWLPLPDLPDLVIGSSEGYHFQPVSETYLWLAGSAGEGGAFSEKIVFVSTDAGQSWELRARSPGHGAVGHIGGYGYMHYFTAVSMKRAFMGLGRYTLYGTKDAGRTWQEAIPFPIANPREWTVGPIYFLDELHDWVIAPTTIFRTTDGGDTWEAGQAPGFTAFPSADATALTIPTATEGAPGPSAPVMPAAVPVATLSTAPPVA